MSRTTRQRAALIAALETIDDTAEQSNIYHLLKIWKYSSLPLSFQSLPSRSPYIPLMFPPNPVRGSGERWVSFLLYYAKCGRGGLCQMLYNGLVLGEKGVIRYLNFCS